MSKPKVAFYSLDDNEDDSFHLNKLIKEIGGVEAFMFTNPNKFREALTKNVHVYVIDEKIDGFELRGLDMLKEIKAINEDNVAIAYVGHNDPDVMEDYINIGINGWVNKNEKEADEKLKGLLKKALGAAQGKIDFATYMETLHDGQKHT